MKIKNNKSAMECISYILDHEAKDFYKWLEDENIEDPNCERARNHVYWHANNALGLVLRNEEEVP